MAIGRQAWVPFERGALKILGGNTVHHDLISEGIAEDGQLAEPIPVTEEATADGQVGFRGVPGR
jgi:hypothetical protein